MAASVQSLDRALTLLELVAADPEGRRLSDLARAAGLAVSTTHRLLTTLEQRGFVQTDATTARWHVGRRAHTVGAAWSTARTLLAPALPHLRRLRDATRETANLGILEGAHVVTVSQAESREIMRAISPPGGRVPILCSGMGKAIVATWDDSQIAALIDRDGLTPATAHSLTSRSAVQADISAIRARGYAIDDEEFVIGLRCVAAVIRGPGGEPVGAVSVSGLAARMTPAKVAASAEKVMQIADTLSGVSMEA
ncbi:IclR family transcriptional regulator [Pseudooceanicola sp. C21-150M6]|uniref:IclR family transcriptional regulator n=1 Tax=Pseudooceanicola sp. C21-150M6 TaxID=3434355 RepID=UPI003D7FF468